jgi:hypothetical protein
MGAQSTAWIAVARFVRRPRRHRPAINKVRDDRGSQLLMTCGTLVSWSIRHHQSSSGSVTSSVRARQAETRCVNELVVAARHVAA